MVARRVLTLAAVGALLAACFSDLPEATTCPPLPQRVVGDCLQQLVQSNPMPGCLKQPLHECLLGPRSDCSCGASECPESASACFPAPDCPATVRAMVPSATCLKPGMADAAAGCGCGCARCVAVCDGYGPSLGAIVPPGGGPMALLNVSLGSALPASGKLGYYVRLRGTAQMVITVAHGMVPLAQRAAVFSDFQSDTQFREVILAPADGASWSSADMTPTSIVLTAAPAPQGNPGMPQGPGITYVQVDCVLPILMQ